MADEAAIQRFVKGLIEKGELLSSIEEVDAIRHAADALRSRRVIPTMTIDGIQREQTVLAADAALSALEGLEIVSDNTSISRRTGEILKPDYVLFNRRLGKIVLVELKDDALPEREGVSELLAYERELLNHFPFLGQLDIVFVLIAREWNDLLTHAYAALAAHGRPAQVGLSIHGEAPNLHLRARSEEAWTRHYCCGIGAEALLSRSYIVRFPDDNTCADLCVLYAADLMRQVADRSGQHGFCQIWEKPDEPNAMGVSVYCIDPAYLLRPGDDPITQRRESELTGFFEELLSQERIVYQNSLETLVDTLRRALGPVPCITHLRDGHWNDDLAWLERIGAQPREFRYWGMIADFSVRMALSPAAREHYRLPEPLNVAGTISGFHIIAAMTGDQRFRYGRITAKPLFQFARLLRLAVDFAASTSADPVTWVWNQLRLMPFVAEAGYLTQSWVETTAPEEPLMLFARPDASSALNIARFSTWLVSLFEDHPLQQVFKAGWLAAETSAPGQSVCEALANAIAAVKEGACSWADCQPVLPEGMRGESTPARLPDIVLSTAAGWASLESILEVADRWIPYLSRRQRSIDDVVFDMEGLRNGITDVLPSLASNELPCVAIDADGKVGTAVITLTPQMKMPVNHAQEVAVLNRSLDHDVLAILNWTDLSHGRLTELHKAIVGNPISLEEWSLVDSSRADLIDNLWRQTEIDPNHYGFRPSGPRGARFFRLALSAGAPSEIAFVVNTASERTKGGWNGDIDSHLTIGFVPFAGAKIGFVALRVSTCLAAERHLLLFDACDHRAHHAIDYLRRQACIHVFVAREDGEVIAVHQCPNIFELDKAGPALALLNPDEHQNQAKSLIANHRGEIECRLSPDLLDTAS